MTKYRLRDMRDKLGEMADQIQAVENAGKNEQHFNELWTMLDDAGAIINEILGEAE